MHIGSYLVMYSVLAALETSGYQAPLVRTGDFGRSSYLITEEHLRFLLSCGFVATQIAEILDVSVSAVKRRLRRFNLPYLMRSARLSNAELDEVKSSCSRLEKMKRWEQMLFWPDWLLWLFECRGEEWERVWLEWIQSVVSPTAPENLQCCRTQLAVAHRWEPQTHQVYADDKLVTVRLNTQLTESFTGLFIASFSL